MKTPALGAGLVACALLVAGERDGGAGETGAGDAEAEGERDTEKAGRQEKDAKAGTEPGRKARGRAEEKESESEGEVAAVGPKRSTRGLGDKEDWSQGRVVRVPIEGTIDLGLAPFIERAMKGLGDKDTMILDIDTFGGRVDAAVRMRDALLQSKARTVAYVDRRAISAGALIALACRYIVMAEGATMGAATPFSMGPAGGAAPQPKSVEEKMISYVRKEFKATAEARGRPVEVVEGMVDPDVVIEGLKKKGKVLTLTTDEAIAWGMAEAVARSDGDLLARLGLAGREPERIAENWAERIARFLTDPVVAGLLVSVGGLAIVMALYSGGNLVMLAAGLSCLLLFFFGHHVVRLAGWEELALFLLGATLLAVEVLVIPGFGFAGVAGVVLLVGSLAMALVDLKTVPFEVSWEMGFLTHAFGRVMASLLGTVVLGLIAVKLLPRTALGRTLVLAEVSGGRVDGPGGADPTGMEGVAETDLRPAGKARVDGRRLDVVTDGAFIDRGARVRVVRVEGARVVVRKQP